jgi:NAD+ diphosphatase
MNGVPGELLATASLDRLGHLRRDADWLAQAWADGRHLALWRRRVLVTDGEQPRPLLLGAAELEVAGVTGPRVLLGHWGDLPCFALELERDTAPALPGAFAELRTIGQRLAPEDLALLSYARAMIGWHERHRHCSACGAITESIEAGHVRRCPCCGARHFPRVDPAIIVLVADEQRCLLGRQPAWPADRYSTIAGFVEPGESLADAVRREVLEETGVRVGTVRYLGSQPWPFPSSLMLGFNACPEGGEIALRDGELEDARWFGRDEIAAGEVLLPPKVSIAWRLIEAWYDAAPGRRLAAEVEPGPWLARPET